MEPIKWWNYFTVWTVNVESERGIWIWGQIRFQQILGYVGAKCNVDYSQHEMIHRKMYSKITVKYECECLMTNVCTEEYGNAAKWILK